MRITTTYLKQVIKEELEFVLREEDFLNEGIKDFVKSAIAQFGENINIARFVRFNLGD